MPTTLASIDSALFSAFKSGDQAALEKIFRACYTPLVDEAIPILKGDGAAAARTVETVFVDAWKARANIPDAAALDAGLHGSVSDNASRIVSRHEMAHHLDELEGGHKQKSASRPAPGVDEAWLKVAAAIQATRGDAAAARQEAGAISRHEAATQLAAMERPESKGLLILMGVIAIIAVAGFAVYAMRGSDASELASGIAAPDVHVSQTGSGEMLNINLTDGSKATLGPQSRMRVPAKFGTSMRGLDLAGTADFTVAPKDKPKFLVRAGPALVTAKGTQFTVRNFPEENRVTVYVRDGSVSVTAKDSTRTISKGAAIVVSADSLMRDAGADEIKESVGWTDSVIVVNKRPLREALVEFKRWYGWDLMAAEPKSLDKTVSFEGRVGKYDGALLSLQQQNGLTKDWKGQNMVLKETGAGAAPRNAAAPPKKK
ncbi:MAG TPA: FecR domain-containing protein [Gemmatimonadaceae bacterium]|nr:FecR domain-containing protein [Gemmatimonadaceae bacterium]